jgi:hypothetical protein
MQSLVRRKINTQHTIEVQYSRAIVCSQRVQAGPKFSAPAACNGLQVFPLAFSPRISQIKTISQAHAPVAAVKYCTWCPQIVGFDKLGAV